jgi:hypothetical protein
MAADEVRAFLIAGTRTANLATVTGELRVRVAPTKIIAARDVAD